MATIFHITTATEWQAAQTVGSYTGSTRGRTLAEEGFVHCSRGDQWPKVRDLHYADVEEPLVLLKIDTDRLDVPVIDEAAPDSEETFPHIYGPVPADAVTQVIDLSSTTAAESPPTSHRPSNPEQEFGPYFLKEMFRNAAVLFVLCANVMGGAVIGHAIRDDGYGALVGLVLGALVGVPLAVAAKRQLAVD